jgi:xanthine dehydrogenase accessory factor
MKDVLEQLLTWAERRAPAALATVVEVRRSAPRPPGAKMAVGPGGEIAGAVSGGCVESEVVLAAEEVRAGAPPRLMRFGVADEDAWDAGLPCGGEIDVWVERFDGRGASAAFARMGLEGGRGALVTAVGGTGATGAQLLADADGATTGTLGHPGLDAAARQLAEELMWVERSELRAHGDARLFVDAVFPAPRLFIFGAIDFAAQLCTLARSSGWRPYVIDPRERFATPARFPDAEAVVSAWPGEAVRLLGGIDRATSIAVLTHEPRLDDAALVVALRSPAQYVGAMGSRRAQERRRERLLAAGLHDTELERLAAPIGLDLGAHSPEETALSIMAEVVAVRRGHRGGRLRDASGRIHEVGA